MVNSNKVNRDDSLLIAKFLLGECDEAELRQITRLLEEDETFAKRLFDAEQLYELGKRDNDKETLTTKQAENQLMKRIALFTTTPQVGYVVSSDEKRGGRYTHLIRRLWPLQRTMRFVAVFAAICLLSVVGYYAVVSPSGSQQMLAVTTQDETKEFKLPDGTSVRLNRYSTLKYSREGFGQKREVFLEGEGYFEVTKNPANPFVVENEVMQVRVLGTIFNLKADSQQRTATATLLKGEVEVKGQHGEGHICLSPGQMAQLDAHKRRLIVKQADAGVDQWYSRTLKFEKADLNAISTTLEKVYGVKVILSPDLDLKKTYTGTVPRKERVEEMLDLLQNAMPIKYKVVGNSVFITK